LAVVLAEGAPSSRGVDFLGAAAWMTAITSPVAGSSTGTRSAALLDDQRYVKI
jgi:hypothetical protein